MSVVGAPIILAILPGCGASDPVALGPSRCAPGARSMPRLAAASPLSSCVAVPVATLGRSSASRPAIGAIMSGNVIGAVSGWATVRAAIAALAGVAMPVNALRLATDDLA